MRLNKAEILRLVEDGYVIVNTHPDLPLQILNYSRKTQFEKYWNEYTLMARGLVIDGECNVIAMAFPKFFNYEEHKPEDIPAMGYEVYDKMDGSLGILFHYADQWHIATRGSFVSDQAIRAKEILKKYNITSLYKDMTYLFEIIYPENRIVVNYGDDEKLVLLGMMRIGDGNFTDKSYDYMLKHIEATGLDMPIVKRYESASIMELKARNILNEEGYILRYDNGFRMKVKFEDYCRLHSIITNVSTKDIWACLRDGRDMNELLENTPDEFDEWVRKQISILKGEFAEIENAERIRVEVWKSSMKDPSSKKEFAELVTSNRVGISAVQFKMFDGKRYDDVIWRLIEPKFSKPFFKQDDDAE